MVSTTLALIACVPRIEIIVEIIGLAVKIDSELIVEMLVEVLEESKIDVFKINVSKIDVSIKNVFKITMPNTVEEGRVYSLVDEVEVTSVNDVLS